MKGRAITAKIIAEFKEHLILEERSTATIEKYIRDVEAFAAYAQNNTITKETVEGSGEPELTYHDQPVTRKTVTRKRQKKNNNEIA